MGLHSLMAAWSSDLDFGAHSVVERFVRVRVRMMIRVSIRFRLRIGVLLNVFLSGISPGSG